MAGNNLAAFRWQSAGAGKTSDLSWQDIRPKLASDKGSSVSTDNTHFTGSTNKPRTEKTE